MASGSPPLVLVQEGSEPEYDGETYVGEAKVEMNCVVHPPRTASTIPGAVDRNFCCLPNGSTQVRLVTQYRSRLAASRAHLSVMAYRFSVLAQLYMFFDQVKFELNVNDPMRFWISAWRELYFTLPSSPNTLTAVKR